MKIGLFLFSFLFLLASGAMAQQVIMADTMMIHIDDSLKLKEGLHIPSSALPAVVPAPLQMMKPGQTGINQVQEGRPLSFKLQASGGADSSFAFSLLSPPLKGMQLDSSGHFSWVPDYSTVSRLQTDSTLQLVFEVKNKAGERSQLSMPVVVKHTNRAPVAGDLKPLYVQYNTLNTYTIEKSAVYDEDGDPLLFVAMLEKMPEGAQLSPQGVFSWKPSLTQFNQLRSKPLLLEFYVEDQPAKTRSKGYFRIEVTQQDLPPSIQMVPSQAYFRYKEDANIRLQFQLYDPNGDADISSFSLLSDHTEVPAAVLKKILPSQYEFSWTPGYDFVKDPKDSVSFNITFYVIDRANKKEERRVRFTILNAVNEAELDQKLYSEYRGSLLRAWDLMEQLKEAEEALKKRYRKAKKGKKWRSVTNASLGAATGITPVVVDEPGTTKKITAIGGTAVMTIGTLEATEVIGRSTKDLVERLNYIMEKRNELQTKGDSFARRYALKSARRKPEFFKDVEELIAVMNLRGLVALELDAGWKNKDKASDQNIARTFKDFSANGN